MSDCCPSPEPDRLVKDPKWLKIAFWLLILTLLYNVIEAVISIVAGYIAGSIALVGFGFDSLIEMSASGLMVWRLAVELKGSAPEIIERTEHTVHRFVGWTFFALSAYIAYESATALYAQEVPHKSLVGIIIATLSLLIMPALAWGKLKSANKLNSPALRAEAKETIACTILSLILLVGLAANATVGWWWADSVAGLLMIPWLIKEGVEGIKGEGCCD